MYNLLTVANRNGESEKASEISKKNNHKDYIYIIEISSKLTGESFGRSVFHRDSLVVRGSKKPNNSYS